MTSISINKEEYEKLKDDSLKLSAIEECGIETWGWYSQSVEEYERKKKKEVDRAFWKEKLEEVFNDGIHDIGLTIYEPSVRGAGYDFCDKEVQKLLNNLIEVIIEEKNK